MEIRVDEELCEANEVCVMSCPEVFKLEDEDIVRIDASQITDARREAIESAVRRCPRQALSLIEQAPSPVDQG